MKEYEKPQRSQSKFNSLCSPKEFPLKEITEKIIACAIEVHSTLGPGLLESVYEEALAYEFELRGIRFERQKEIVLEYKGKSIGPHRTIDKFQCREVKRWDKKISFIRGYRGAGMRFLCKYLIKQSLCVLCGKSFPST